MVDKTALPVTIKKTESKITPRAGLVLIEKIARELGMDQLLILHFGHHKRRKRGLKTSRQILDIASMLIDGGSRMEDIRQLAGDDAWQQIRDKSDTMAPRTARDVLYRFSAEDLARFEKMEKHMSHRISKRMGREETATIDADATFIEADKKEASFSYHKEKGYYPMLGFWAERGTVIQGEFRDGNEPPLARALEFLQKCESCIPKDIDRLCLRADAAWFQSQVMDYCTDQCIEFAIGGHRNEPMYQSIEAIDPAQWEKWTEDPEVLKKHPEQNDWEISETVYAFNEGKYSYRVVVIRKPFPQLDMFKGVIYEYDIVVTNRAWEKRRLVKWYWERCNCENWIKELKYGFGLNQFPCSQYVPNGAYFHIVLLAFNLVQALKLLKLSYEWRTFTVKTLRYHLFHVAGLLVRHARQLFLKLYYRYPHYDLFRSIVNPTPV